MGNSVGTDLDEGHKELIQEQFELVKKDEDRDFLTVSEVIKMTPPDDYNVKLTHISNLFVMDSDKDGRFSLNEIYRFAEYCRDESDKFKGYEFTFQLQAQSTLLMWKQLQEGGEDEFAAWMGRLLYENFRVEYFKICPGVPFVNIESVKLLYDLLDMHMLKSFSLQDFFNLLQHSAEESNLMPLESKELDNYIPLSICQDFSKEFLIGFSKLFKDIGLHKNK